MQIFLDFAVNLLLSFFYEKNTSEKNTRSCWPSCQPTADRLWRLINSFFAGFSTGMKKIKTAQEASYAVAREKGGF